MELPINQIIHADCLEFMKTLPDKCIDLVLTDPPYGIGADKGIGGGSNRGRVHKFKGDWDEAIPSEEYYRQILRISKNQIVFGGNYMTKFLPPKASWIIWDKREGLPQRTFADCEMIWVSDGKPARIFRFKWDGMIQENMKDKEYKYHPTIKPLELIKYCLERFPDANIILDPFAGSCTTAIACMQLGRKYICIEKEADYVKICHERLAGSPKSMFV